MLIKKIKLIGMVLLVSTILLMSVSAVSAETWHSSAGDSDDHFYVHTCNWGSVFKANHWTAPNGVAFTDKAWILAYLADFTISFRDSNGNLIDTVSKSMTSGSGVLDIVIPNGATTMDVSVDDFDITSGAKSAVFSGIPTSGGGAMNFDGTTKSKNFHLKMVDGWDSSYVNIQDYATIGNNDDEN
ncbi:MAG: hypothetical protein LBM96_01080 [Methanobrevibacter sp.]|jgi:hypothetical protein|nr:hypothetical protein [Candidatus Methanoflexus mossambicus]